MNVTVFVVYLSGAASAPRYKAEVTRYHSFQDAVDYLLDLSSNGAKVINVTITAQE